MYQISKEYFHIFVQLRNNILYLWGNHIPMLLMAWVTIICWMQLSLLLSTDHRGEAIPSIKGSLYISHSMCTWWMRTKKIQKPRKKDWKNEKDPRAKNYMKCITAQLTVIFQLDRVEERGRDPTRWIKVVQNDKKKDKRKNEKKKVNQMEIK